MPRTTIDIDGPLLTEMKGVQRRVGKTLSEIVRESLARYISEQKRGKREPPTFHWISRPMGLKVDPADKDALYAALDADGQPR